MNSKVIYPRLLFVEQFYFPEGWGGAEIPRDVTVHLAKAGFDVQVICGSDQYAPVGVGEQSDPTASGVRIWRVPKLLPGRASQFKLLRQFLFYVCMTFRLFTVRRPHILIAQTNPPLGVFFAALAARIRGVRFVIIAQDLYPEVLVAHGVLAAGGSAERLLSSTLAWAYRVANCVVAVGPVMAERIRAKGVLSSRVAIISNWSTGGDAVLRGSENLLAADWGLAGKFVVLYSGNLGIGHEFDTLLEGVSRALGNCPDLRLVFVGQGSRLEEVRRRVAANSLESHVVFHPLVPASRLSESLGLADLAVVTLRPGFEGLIVPSKLLGYMARGISTLFIGPPSDVSAIVEESGGGFNVKTGDSGAVADLLSALYVSRQSLVEKGDSGRRYYLAKLSQSAALAQYEALIRGCMDQHGPLRCESR